MVVANGIATHPPLERQMRIFRGDGSVIHLYVAPDAEGASDSNVGDDPTRALVTLSEVASRLNALSYVNRIVVVHLASATYDMSGFLLTELELALPVIIIGDGAGQAGDDGFTELASGTAQAGTTASQVVTGGGLSSDAFVGKTLVATDGLASGWRRSIFANDTTNVDLVAPMTGFAEGDGFRVVEPAVVLQCPSLADNPYSVPAIEGVGHAKGATLNPAVAQVFSPGALTLVNVRFGVVPGSFTGDIVLRNSTVRLYGVEGVGSGAGLAGARFIMDDASSLAAGVDFMVGTFHAAIPLLAGLVDDDQAWLGYGYNNTVGGNNATVAITNFLGFLFSDDRVVFQGDAKVQLLGGRLISDDDDGTLYVEGSKVILQGSDLNSYRLRIDNTADDTRTACLMVCGFSHVHMNDLTMVKTNRGYGLVGFAQGNARDASAPQISIGSVTLTAVTDVGTPAIAIAASGGARINFRPNDITISAGWGTAECGVIPRLNGTPGAGASGTLAGLSADGDAYPTVASGLTMVHGVIQRH